MKVGSLFVKIHQSILGFLKKTERKVFNELKVPKRPTNAVQQVFHHAIPLPFRVLVAMLAVLGEEDLEGEVGSL